MNRVLVVAMDWGLGHAARCVPVIRGLQNRGCQVWMASSGAALALLRAECDGVPSFEMPPYNVRYTRHALFFALIMQLPKFVLTIVREHRWVQQIIRTHQIDCIISDNRYGCYAKNTHSILITHQLNILWPLGWGSLGTLANGLLGCQLKKFSECWVPDDRQIALTGALTKSSIPFRYVGFLSRFCFRGNEPKRNTLLVLLSGPEPQRSILERIIIPQLRERDAEWLLVRGVKESSTGRAQTDDQRIVDFLAAEQLQNVIEWAEVVVCRSGYSTLMDLIALKKKAILVPTPGQTEQEYLASHCQEKKIAGYKEQHTFVLKDALDGAARFSGFGAVPMKTDALTAALDELVKQVESK
jgi:UDP:flavonoid glycosyltransferase YjiC (YdhE family)